jgi:hypothetical protein
MMVFRLLPLIADAGDILLSGSVVKLHDHPVRAQKLLSTHLNLNDRLQVASVSYQVS